MKSDRRSVRIKRRTTCELAVDGRRYRGIVLDLSETGVFVQTEATPTPGAPLQLRFHAGDGTSFEVEASVARRQVAPPQLAGVVRGGLGLRVHTPPPAYFELLGQDEAQAANRSEARAAAAARRAASPPLEAGAAAPAQRSVARTTVRSSMRPASPAPAPAPAPPPAPVGDPFRVRVKQCAGPRSRTVEVCASTAEDAAKRALADLGRGWEVLRVERA
jgi:PilZ domain